MAIEFDAAAPGERIGRLRYLASSVEPSLRRNGKVLTRRDVDGNDAGSVGMLLEHHDMPIANARAATLAPTLARNGFELVASMPPAGLDFLDHEQVIKNYYGDAAQIVKQATGATDAIPFDHNVRSARGKKSRRRIEGGQQVQGPAHLVHGDYTLTSAPQRLRDLTHPLTGNDTLRPFLPEEASLLEAERVEHVLSTGQRFAIVNLWRNIAQEPVHTHPLALCDAQTVTASDLVVFEIHYAERIGENYFSKHAPEHQWYCYPELTRNEGVLIKQWDSAGPLASSEGAAGDATEPSKPCTFSFHSAFDDPSTPPEAPDRWSIEVRCVVFYD